MKFRLWTKSHTKSTMAAIALPIALFAGWMALDNEPETLQAEAVPASVPSRPLVAPLSSSWTKSDYKAMRAANAACEAISDDYTYEACVVGDFTLTTGKLLTSEGYEYDDAGSVVLGGKMD